MKILGPQAGIKLESPALENRVSTPGPPGKSTCRTLRGVSLLTFFSRSSPPAARAVLGSEQGLNVCVVRLVPVLTQAPFLRPGFHSTCPGLPVAQPCREEKPTAGSLRALPASELGWINRPTAPKIGPPCLPHSLEMCHGHP